MLTHRPKTSVYDDDPISIALWYDVGVARNSPHPEGWKLALSRIKDQVKW